MFKKEKTYLLCFIICLPLNAAITMDMGEKSVPGDHETASGYAFDFVPSQEYSASPYGQWEERFGRWGARGITCALLLSVLFVWEAGQYLLRSAIGSMFYLDGSD